MLEYSDIIFTMFDWLRGGSSVVWSDYTNCIKVWLAIRQAMKGAVSIKEAVERMYLSMNRISFLKNCLRVL